MTQGQRISILTYHQIADAPVKGTPYRSLVVSPRLFAAQMQMLKVMGYQGVSMGHLLPFLRGEKTGKVVGITFDDGYQNNLVHAMPVLRAVGFGATCYVVSDRIGKTNTWDQSQGIPQVPLMDRNELREWIAAGLEIGAHTRQHVHLPNLDDTQAWNEINGSRCELEQLLGVSVQHFCYPYGEYCERDVVLAQKAKFLTATTTRRGRVQAGDSLLELRRVPILRRTHRLLLAWKLLTSYEDRAA